MSGYRMWHESNGDDHIRRRFEFDRIVKPEEFLNSREFGSDHPATLAHCTAITATRDPNNPLAWTVTATYAPKTDN